MQTQPQTTQELTDALIATFSPRIQALFSVRGQIISLQIGRPAKVRKGMEPVYKYSRILCRCGIDYNAQKDVIAKRLDGTLPSEPQAMSWGEWVPNCFPYLKHYKDSYYFRFSTLKSEHHKKDVQWVRDGKEISESEAKEVCLASEFPKEDRDLDCFDLRVEHILEINGKPV
jgi:hypothetical protein